MPSAAEAQPASGSGVETVVFVDVDGVLNVGIQDEGNSPVLFKEEEVRLAQRLFAKGYKGPEADLVAKVCALATHPVDYGSATFEKLMSEGELSDILVSRLAGFIAAGGKHCTVVLSSSWRRWQHRHRRQQLEQALGRHLGRPFHFHATTPTDRDEKYASQRLETIGEFLAEQCGKNFKGSHLKVLVLDDFFVTDMDGWQCGGKTMDSVRAAEEYLESMALKRSTGQTVAVKLLHCYKDIMASNGLRMQVGSGLSQEHVDEAHRFVHTPAPASESANVTVAARDDATATPADAFYWKDGTDEGSSFLQVVSAFVPPVTPVLWGI
eukprot:gb/GFBE01064453.1/.p1 GENE.gb/GFBE01064453.1/~~gb/GFBE01064453.1/.p1  ORF type:complete len:324 (+),score=56.82 gb/GFBE01064453.1/:1-972(+)